MAEPKRVLVLGATGHVGQAVIRHALEKGREVTALTRQADPLALRGLAVDVIRISNLESLPELAASHDLIIDAAAPYALDPAPRGSFEWRRAVDAALRHAELVVEAARRQRVPLAFVSSFTTLPRNEPPWAAAETAWRRSAYPYFEGKAAMERAVIHAGLPAVIVNPAACLGPWEFRGEDSSFVRLVLARRLPAVIDQTICVIDVRDVAEAIDRAVSRQLFGRPIALAGHNITVAELAARIAQLDGNPGAAPLTVDRRVASATAFWTQAAFAAFGRTAPDLWRAVPLLADSFAMQPSLEQSQLELSIRPLGATLRDAIGFFRGW